MTDINQYVPLWGAWQVDSLIGEGSFGKVYKIRREEFGKTYYSAVKLITVPQNEADLRQIRGEGMDDASLRSYFHSFVADIIQEIDLMSEFRGNSNIVSFEDHKVIEKEGQIGWDILIRMELLTSLTDHVMSKPLPQDDVVKLGIHICKALELCAAHNTIHRDIKPDNIFISRYGDYKLGDFGIARQIERTSAGLSKKGTYTYMAPEVFRGDDYGASVDMYSLGLVMYRFLNQNRTPFLPDFPTAITPRDRDDALQRRMRGEPLPGIGGIDPSLNAVVLKACAYDRKERFATPSKMREELEALAGIKSYAPLAVPIKTDDEAEEEKIIDNTSATEGVFTVPAAGQDLSFTEATSQTEGVFDDVPVESEAHSSDKPQKRRLPVLIGLAAVIVVAVVLSAWFLGFWPPGSINHMNGSPGSYMGNNSDPLWENNDYAFNEPYDELPTPMPPQPLTPTSSPMPIPTETASPVETDPPEETPEEIERVEIDLWSQDIDNSRLSELITSGTIPYNVTHLFLGSNNISDITPLQYLPYLTDLEVNRNQISDLRQLRYLPNLTSLRIGNNPVNDFTPLRYLVNLEEIFMGPSSITDLTPLQTLTNLTVISINSAQISDLSPLQSLMNLTYISMGSNQIDDLSPIQTLTNLTLIDMTHNQIDDLSPLQTLTNLTLIFMSDNQIDDLSPLQALTNLQSISIADNPINDFTPLQHLPNLIGISISSDQFSDLSPLQRVLPDLSIQILD